MKKIFLVFALGAFLASCGRTACECMEDLGKMETLTDSKKQKEWEEDCGKYTPDELLNCKN